MTRLFAGMNGSELIDGTAITPATERSALPTPPRWLMHFAMWFRIGFACFLLVGCLLGLTGCAGRGLALNGQPLQWLEAHQVAPMVLQQAFDQLTIVPREEQPGLPVLASRITGQEGQMIVFNFSRVPQLCGVAGCLFAAYAQVPKVPPTLDKDEGTSYGLVWRQYLQPVLPNGVSVLFRYDDSEELASEFPTLIANQIEDNHVRQIVFSWNSGAYQLEKTIFNQQLVELH